MDLKELARFTWRRSSWLSAIGHWARPEYCGACQRFEKCRRYKMNEKVILAFAKAKVKKTYKSQMKYLKSDEKCHDFAAILDYFMKPAPKDKPLPII